MQSCCRRRGRPATPGIRRPHRRARSQKLSTPELSVASWIGPLCMILKTAVDRRRCRQVRDLYGFPTAAHFTRWVTTAVSASTWG